MEQRALGGSGLEVSVVGLGCNNFGGLIPSLDLEGARKVVHAALDAGITLFDTADSYGQGGGSEKTLGEILGARRKDVVLATKFASPLDREKSSRFNGSRGYLMGAIEASLRRLRTDYIDLYQYHFPDPQTPIEETLRARRSRAPGQGALHRLLELRRLAAPRCELDLAPSRPAPLRVDPGRVQPALTPGGDGTVPGDAPDRHHAAALLPAGERPADRKYRQGQPIPEGTRLSLPRFQARLSEAGLDRVEKLIAFSEARGHSILELAFSWLLARPLVTSVIAGATRPEQVAANARSAGWQLSAEELAEVDAICA